ncbi:MAG TPA: hypothetical protein DET40_13355 [Lentisphaeria bacterium]|nr:MAG: hypothetical protein A2X45_22700 [Lentisphaerae bacterium GWF2_50_93]HCE44528.1 hypothetical protein [Lentisphaeria bacterium]
MYYIHKKELFCPKCGHKFTVSWKEWRELLFFPDDEPYWYTCPSCKQEFGDEERKKREAEFQKISKPMMFVVAALVLVILGALGYLFYVMHFK